MRAPYGGPLYRHSDTIVLPSPRIGPWSSVPPAPHGKCIHDGPAVSIDFHKPIDMAGVTLRVLGNTSCALPYRLAMRTGNCEEVFALRTIGSGWVAGGHLRPILPTSPPIIGTGISVTATEPLKAMAIRVIDDGR